MVVVRIFQAMFCALGVVLLGAAVWTAGEIDGPSNAYGPSAYWTCTSIGTDPPSENCLTNEVTLDSTSTATLGSSVATGLAGIGSILLAIVIGTGRGPTAAAVPTPAMGPGWGGPPGPYRGPPPPGWAGPTAPSPGPPPSGATPGSSGPGT